MRRQICPLRVFFLVGQTAVGKSAVAQWLAEHDGCDILSADSMLVYTGMDIGTAKPGADERATVRHHGIDLVTPDTTFNVWAYRRHAIGVLRENCEAGRSTIVVGGTGLYVKSLIEGLASPPDVDPAVRRHWTDILARQGVDALQQELRGRSPALYDALQDKQNGRRLVRALELAEAGVKEPPAHWRRPSKDRRPAPAATGVLPALERPPDQLKLRIESRVADMYRRGLIREAEGLVKTYATLSPTALKAIGYMEAIECLNGRCSEEEARARTVSRTWQLARRQRTWFKHQAHVRWIEVDGNASVEAIAARVKRHWDEYGATEIRDQGDR